MSAINQQMMDEENTNSVINQLRQAMAHLALAELEVTGATQSTQIPEEFIAAADPSMLKEPTGPDFTGSFMSGIGRTFSINGTDTVINIGGVNLGTLQFGGSQEDGKFYAGAGAVENSSDGININVEAAASNLRAYTFKNSVGQIIGGMYGKDPTPAIGPRRDVLISVNSASDTDSRATIEAYAPAGFDAQVWLYAQQGAGADNVGLNLDATTGQIDINRAGSALATIGKNGADDKFHINPNGIGLDFIVEGGTDADLIRTVASTNRVGIGTSSPATILDVDGTITAAGLEVNGTVTSDGLTVAGIVDLSAGSVTINSGAGNYDTIIQGDTDASLLVADASTDRIGIGTASPATKLDVNGTITADGLNLFGIDSANTANWTPSFSGLTVGNGTLTAKYAVIGSVVSAWVSLIFGTTTSISGSVTCSIPISTMPITNVPIGTSLLVDTGTANLLGRVFSSTTTTVLIGSDSVSGSNIVNSLLSSTAPFTWTTNDQLNFSFTYPIG